MTKDTPVTYFEAPDTLRKRVIGAGGKTREQAVRDAAVQIAKISADADAGIAAAIATIETIAAPGGDLTEESLKDILMSAERILSLAAAFNNQRLQAVAQSLGELGSIFLTAGKGSADAIGVHAQAAKLFSRHGGPEIPEAVIDTVLVELARVRGHFFGRTANRAGGAL
ncbi:MAG: hypothetical protein U1E87_03160 [Alphaproteobacteria bacterium]